MMLGFFGPGVAVCVMKEHQIDNQLMGLFQNLMPTPLEVNMYFRKFCDKYEFSVERFSKVYQDAPYIGRHGWASGT